MAADGAGADSLCRPLVSSLLAVAARCRRVVRRARSGGGSHDDLALGATIQSRIGNATSYLLAQKRRPERLGALLARPEIRVRTTRVCQVREGKSVLSRRCFTQKGVDFFLLC